MGYRTKILEIQDPINYQIKKRENLINRRIASLVALSGYRKPNIIWRRRENIIKNSQTSLSD